MWPFKRKPPAATEPPAPTRQGAFSTSGQLPEYNRAIIDRYNAATGQQPFLTSGMDDYSGSSQGAAPSFKGIHTEMPDALLGWYASQRFIGYQMCAMIAQQWLVDKACTMPARDAIRHGFEVQSYSDDLDLADEQQADLEERLKRADRHYELFKHLAEFVRMGRVFGIRIAFFKIRGATPDFYENPFNIDGIAPGSYEGIVQVDPYWCTPLLSGESAADPSSMHFYEPEWWTIRGQRFHRSHLVIFRNGEVPDVLKPLYQYGGVSVPQRIFERVYAAERTANEAPQLAMTKRTMVQNTDISTWLLNPAEAIERMTHFSYFRDNYGIKIVDTDDVVAQHDTSLADLDAVIMTQYQIVAAAAGVPATKLLGTTPKGFQSTGEYEAQSYHEELETIQANDLTRFVNRHHQLVMRSNIEADMKFAPGQVRVEIDWNPVDSPTAKEYAEINKINADTDNVLVTVGAIDATDVRNRLRGDNSSGYTDLAEMVAPLVPDEGDDILTDLLGDEGSETPQDPLIPEA